MSDKTLRLTNPPMKGAVVTTWQQDIKATFADMYIHCPIVVDGVYGEATRSYSAALCRASGLKAERAMEDGVTPELRIKLRNQKLTVTELKIKDSQARQDYRANLRKRWTGGKVHAPVTKILEDSWGYHPPVHDGLDVICLAEAPIFAMCKAKVIDVRSSGWWGKGAPTNPEVKAKGDGVIQIEVLEDVGPFKKGMHIGYGHSEKARVKVGDVVEAGAYLGHAGLANAWHIHLFLNDGGTMKGIGNLDPRPLLDYAVKNG